MKGWFNNDFVEHWCSFRLNIRRSSGCILELNKHETKHFEKDVILAVLWIVLQNYNHI